ncbi:hypothetical protein U1Q18_052424 [Sarracenia purpurea var. burkii]
MSNITSDKKRREKETTPGIHGKTLATVCRPLPSCAAAFAIVPSVAPSFVHGGPTLIFSVFHKGSSSYPRCYCSIMTSCPFSILILICFEFDLGHASSWFVDILIFWYAIGSLIAFCSWYVVLLLLWYALHSWFVDPVFCSVLGSSFFWFFSPFYILCFGFVLYYAFVSVYLCYAVCLCNTCGELKIAHQLLEELPITSNSQTLVCF